MGGTGNTGQTGGFAGSSTPVGGGSNSATPTWTAPVAEPQTTAAPPALRPYENLTGGGPSTGLLSATPPATGPATGTLAPAGPTGFTHTPYPETAAAVPTAAAPPVVAPPVEPEKPAEVAMRQIWPSGSGTAAEWIKSNPNWQTDFNRAEQRADGTWWVPQDPNAPRPAGPQYYQGTGNVIYGGSPPVSGGQR